MAYISKSSKGWRVQVCKCGIRKSRVFDSQDQAEAWGRAVEDSIKSRSMAEEAIDIAIMSEAPCIPGYTLTTSVPKRVLLAMGQIPHQMADILDAAIPYVVGAGIYFLIKNKEIVYVGQSLDVFRRSARHKTEGKEFDSVAYIECQKSELDSLEALYIAAFVPPLNYSLGRSAQIHKKRVQKMNERLTREFEELRGYRLPTTSV